MLKEKAIIYENTKTTLLTANNMLHEIRQRGFAYECSGEFIHIYGEADSFWTLHTDAVIRQPKHGENIKQWAENVFGATNIKISKNTVGEAVCGVWRPGLYYGQEDLKALSTNEYEKLSSEQALRILIEKLDDLLLYIEPTQYGLKTYSHKTRELLILACTEIENVWKQYMRIADYKSSNAHNLCTSDYIKLKEPLFLQEYEVRLKPFENVEPIKPFVEWDQEISTQSLIWYNAYNQTKHDRYSHFAEATLFNCINAVAGNIILFCARYGPYSLFQGSGILSGLINQLFEVRLINPDPSTFYIPKIDFFEGHRCTSLSYTSWYLVRPWVVKPLILK